jgi:hypothetical protein
MIHTDAGLRATREAIVNLEEALLDLTRTRSKYHPATFALLTTPIADEIRARRAEIDEFIGLPPGSSNGHASDTELRPVPELSSTGAPFPVVEPSPATK